MTTFTATHYIFFCCIIVITFVLFNYDKKMKEETPYLRDVGMLTRSLSAKIDLITGENIVTYDGKVPITSCPLGKFRPLTGVLPTVLVGQRTDGCVACPRGRLFSSFRSYKQNTLSFIFLTQH